jgi:hypothetical protein
MATLEIPLEAALLTLEDNQSLHYSVIEAYAGLVNQTHQDCYCLSTWVGYWVENNELHKCQALLSGIDLTSFKVIFMPMLVDLKGLGHIYLLAAHPSLH